MSLISMKLGGISGSFFSPNDLLICVIRELSVTDMFVLSGVVPRKRSTICRSELSPSHSGIYIVSSYYNQKYFSSESYHITGIILKLRKVKFDGQPVIQLGESPSIMNYIVKYKQEIGLF